MIWKPIRDKSGSINLRYIEDSTGCYRVSRARVRDRDVFTAWRGSVALGTGSSESCKQLCLEDSQRPESKTGRQAALKAIANAKRVLDI